MGICQTLNQSVPSVEKMPDVDAASVAIVVKDAFLTMSEVDPSRFEIMNHRPSENDADGRVQTRELPLKLTTRGLDELSV